MKIDKLRFRGKYIGVVIIPRMSQITGKTPTYSCDLEITGWKGRMGAEDFKSLKKYLKDEGYIEQAYEMLNRVEK
jgi:hypothetical protein